MTAGDRAALQRQFNYLDMRTRGVQTEEQAVDGFRRLIVGVISEQALGRGAQERMDKHLRAYASTGKKLDLRGVRELMFLLWVEGFLVGHGYAKERITGEKP